MSDLEDHSLASLDSMLDAESRTTVVDFYSPWCAPCRTLRPHVERAAKSGDAAAIRFVAVNIAEDEVLAKRYGVTSLPTVVTFENGKETNRASGAAILPFLRDFVSGD